MKKSCIKWKEKIEKTQDTAATMGPCFAHDHALLNMNRELRFIILCSVIVRPCVYDSQQVGGWETCHWVMVFDCKPTDGSLVEDKIGLFFPDSNKLRLRDLLNYVYRHADFEAL